MVIKKSIPYKKALKHILEYIAKDKVSAMLKFRQELNIQIKDIPNMPKKHRKSQYYNDDNMRDMIYKGYTIIYEIRNNIIEIHKIFNQNLPIMEQQ